MAQPIVAVKGFEGSITINGVAAKFRGWEAEISNAVIDYMTTGQTADADGQYWTNSISGANSATFNLRGYWDQNATAASRFTGATLSIKPGTSTTGVVVLLFKSGSTFSASVVVQSIRPSIDAESNKPSGFDAVLKVDGPVTYTLA